MIGNDILTLILSYCSSVYLHQKKVNYCQNGMTGNTLFWQQSSKPSSSYSTKKQIPQTLQTGEYNQ